ncbi:MAG: acyl carrier protein [Clostridiaceae bacterium]
MNNMEKLNKIFGRVFGIKNTAEIEDSFGPDEIEGWDSLAHFDLVSELEENFEISIAVEDVSRMYTIGDIKKMLKRYEVEL